MIDESLPFASANALMSLDRPDSPNATSLRNTPRKVHGSFVKLGRTWGDEVQLLIPVENSPGIQTYALTEGLRLESAALLDHSGKRESYVCLTASPNFDRTLFGAVADEVIQELDADPDAVETIGSIVERWAELLRAMGRSRMSQESAIGLFGELLTLEALIELGEIPAITSWVGPTGYRRDFVWDEIAVEVKATVRTDGLFVRIHDVDQLAAVPGERLRLVVVKLEWNPGGVSLTELIRRLLARVPDQRLFFERLEAVHVSADMIDAYEDLRFRVLGCYVFDVNSEFPVITPAVISEIPESNRISRVEYTIGLNGLPGREYPSPSVEMWQEILNG